MAFKVKQLSESSQSVELEEELWLTDDGKVVNDGNDPRAASLLGIPGQRLSREQAEQYGLVGRKQQAPAKNKQRAKAENK